MKKIIPILGFVVLVGCSGDNDFKNFSGRLPVLEAPVKFSNSGLIRYQIQQNYDAILFGKFAPKTADGVLGKLFDDGKTLSIVYLISGDVDTPILMTYSAEGIKLDSLNLFTSNLSEPGEEQRRLITLFPNRQIQTIDSLLMWSEIFNEGNPDITQATRVQTLRMDTAVWLIESNGKIIPQ